MLLENHSMSNLKDAGNIVRPITLGSKYEVSPGLVEGRFFGKRRLFAGLSKLTFKIVAYCRKLSSSILPKEKQSAKPIFLKPLLLASIVLFFDGFACLHSFFRTVG
jgi:hypothetical protein